MKSNMLAIFIIYIGTVCGILKQYNINEESKKLFGTDLSGALASFRRSQDYAKILEDMVADLVTTVKDVSTQELHFQEKEFLSEAATVAKKIPKFKRIMISPHNKLTDEELLDRHLKVYQRTPIKVRNQLRNRGFELASKVIDGCIEALTISRTIADASSSSKAASQYVQDEGRQ